MFSVKNMTFSVKEYYGAVLPFTTFLLFSSRNIAHSIVPMSCCKSQLAVNFLQSRLRLLNLNANEPPKIFCQYSHHPQLMVPSCVSTCNGDPLDLDCPKNDRLGREQQRNEQKCSISTAEPRKRRCFYLQR